MRDYPKLIPFWKENYFVTDMDNETRFADFLKKNPDLSLVAEENDEIVGTVLGSFDGRRGYIQKLVVSKSQRGKGLGKKILVQLVDKLHALGVLYIPISCEAKYLSFYKSCGFKQTEQIAISL